MRKTTVALVAVAAGVSALAAAERAASARSASAPAAPAAVTQLAESAANRMPMAQFKKLFDAGGVVVLDVRGSAPFRDGRIPGAVSVPLDTVGQRAAEWKNETRPVVTYCS